MAGTSYRLITAWHQPVLCKARHLFTPSLCNHRGWDTPTTTPDVITP